MVYAAEQLSRREEFPVLANSITLDVVYVAERLSRREQFPVLANSITFK